MRDRRTEIRQVVQAKRNEFTDRAAASCVIAERMIGLDCYRRASVIMAYAAFRSEVDVDRLIKHALEQNKVVVLPVVDSAVREMRAHAVTDVDQLISGAYGIKEPGPESKLVQPELIDVCIMPGLAFDHQGNRLGYGAGYYDCYLPLLRDDAVRIGAAFSCQVVEDIPPRPGDMVVDVVVTDSAVIWTNARGGN